MDQLIQELMHAELLKDVSDDILEQVSSHGAPFELKAGELLLSPDKDNQHIYLLLSGTLTVHFHSPEAPVLRELHAGYSVGEMSIIDGTRPSAYVKAKGDCRVFPLHRDFLLHLIQTTNPIAYNLLRLLTEWMKSNTQRIINDQFQISELSNQANIDVLTGLYNRRWIDQALPHMLAQSQAMGQSLCVMILDIDHFKNYNDLHGHLGGDVALVAMSNVLKSNIRPCDYAVRIGGEEFMVLLPNTQHNDGLKLAERIRLEIEQQTILHADGEEMPGVTVSIGIAVNDQHSTSKNIFAAADKQLYLAKHGGRNCVK